MAAELVVPQAKSSERRFFAAMTCAILASVFLGFARSFYLRPVFPDTPVPPEPIFLLHGLVFTAWVLLFFLQTRLVAAARIDVHRKTGALGMVLAVAVVVLGVLGALIAARRPGGFIGIPVPPLQFLAIPLASMVMFAAFVALGFLRRRDGQAHKRLMLLATFQFVTPAIARWPGIAPFGPPAFFGLTDLFLIALAAWDFRSRGRLHPVTLWGGLAMIVAQPLQLALLGTDAWLAFARWATGLLG